MTLSPTRWSFAAGLALLAALGLAGTAAGDQVIGTNTVLDANSNTFYIALQPATSGELGDPLGGGDFVGLQPDTVTLYGDGETTSGDVWFILDFDISALLGPGQVVDENTATLELELRDIDFKADVYAPVAVLLESLELTFLPDVAAVPGPVDLMIDETNYGLYATGGFVETDNAFVTYSLHLRDDLGLDAADFAGINDDGKFGMVLDFSSLLEHTRSNCCGDRLRNTSEGVWNSFQFNAIPEPGSLVLLGSGGAVLLLRRRKRS